ncbi:MAG: type II toxin-antitoxin system RelB/DinJ family antitoxin [Fusobacteriaceae bacterium]|jgi:DNA-damage-inducible protein J|nr:type II toxin-antitoxin system RelB/DinJ family antitoxin [Fusobacteriaceae bacterium]
MATTSITFRLDAELKKHAESAFESMGLNMTSALTVFIKTVVREGRIPFQIVTDEYAGPKKSAKEALLALEKYAGTLKRDVDIKKELAEYREERYADSTRH